MNSGNGNETGFRAWVARTRRRFSDFMYGRNGIDSLSHFLFWLIIILAFVNLLTRDKWVITLIELCIFGYSVFRIFSKNVYRRQKENQFYLNCRVKLRDFFAKLKKKANAHASLQKNKWRDRKTHVYKRCPKCKSVLRLPRVKGKHTAACPCCENRFDVRIFIGK